PALWRGGSRRSRECRIARRCWTGQRFRRAARRCGIGIHSCRLSVFRGLLNQGFARGINRLAVCFFGQVEGAFLTTASQQQQHKERSEGSFHDGTPEDERKM